MDLNQNSNEWFMSYYEEQYFVSIARVLTITVSIIYIYETS